MFERRLFSLLLFSLVCWVQIASSAPDSPAPTVCSNWLCSAALNLNAISDLIDSLSDSQSRNTEDHKGTDHYWIESDLNGGFKENSDKHVDGKKPADLSSNMDSSRNDLDNEVRNDFEDQNILKVRNEDKQDLLSTTKPDQSPDDQDVNRDDLDGIDLLFFSV